MTTFALVHGAWHGASCWDATAVHLRAAGHDAVAVDLPIDNPAAGLVDYAATVLQALASVPDHADLVVVGHSLGGVTIPLVAAARPVRELVFLCAFVPLPGVALRDDLLALPDTFAAGWTELAARQEGHGDGSSSWPVDAAVAAFYDDCEPSAALAAARGLRRQHWGVAREVHPLLTYPDVAARAIVCTEDRVLNAESCARHAAERVAAPVERIRGGHCPMVAQPERLAALLADSSAVGL